MQLEPQEICTEVLLEKYAKNDEKDISSIQRRVANALVTLEKDPCHWEPRFYKAQQEGFIPGGRINSAAGMNSESTLINCFIQPVGDSISGYDEDGYPSIYDAVKQAAETMRRGGGVGYDFSRIRPFDAYVKGTQSRASGPLSYMRVFDRSCETVESAGGRRGAQMAVLRCDHPDIFNFITAKSTKGEFTNFNLSIGVTDAFMREVEKNTKWKLVHKAEPCAEYRENNNSYYDVETDKWVWKIINVTDLWNLVMKSTYDFAEPGILFLDRMNEENNLHYCETIEATNPCVTGDTVILTDQGYKRIDSVINTKVNVWNGFDWSITTPRITGENQEIIDFEFSDGSKLPCTPYHKFILEDGTRIEAKDLYVGMKLAKFNFPIIVGNTEIDRKIAYTQGFYSGNGQKDTNRIWLYEEKCNLIPYLSLSAYSDQSIDRNLMFTASLDHFPQPKNFVPNIDFSINTRLDWLAGLIDADGSITEDSCIQIWSIDRDFLQNVKYLLNTLGTTGTISLGRKSGISSLPDGNGSWKDFNCQESWRLSISATNIVELFTIGLNTHRITVGSLPNRDASRFITVTFKHKRNYLEPFVYCFTEEKNHSGIFNGIMTAQCAEQPLPPYGCCDLGSINLTKFVINPFKPDAWFDYTSFTETVSVAIRMLDNVLDVTAWPLEEQQKEASNKRRIGLGFLGLGDAIMMLGKYYNNTSGFEFAREVSRFMRDTAYLTSIDLAKEKGSFPLFDSEQYLNSKFILRLPDFIKNEIKLHGIRNSHLLSIAPTGTISLAFADNASNGIEPPFSWVYDRKKRMKDGTKKTFEVADHAWRLYRSMGYDMDNLPQNFITALDISVNGHIDIMKAVQPYIDTAISKTVNVPADYSYEDFKNLYIYAWRSGLKGLATYRPNDTLGSVLSVKEDKKTVAPVIDNTTIDTDNGKSLDEIILEMYTQPFESREDGTLPGISIKGRFHTNQGEQKFIITINFLTFIRHTRFGKITIRRPVEFILTSNFTTSSSSWDAAMRFLSLLARSGVSMVKVIENLREIIWEYGNVRYGTRIKENKQIAMWHSSDAAVIGYIIEEALIKDGYFNKEGKLAHKYLLENDVTNKAEDKDITLVNIDIKAEEQIPLAPTGKKCPECGDMNVIKSDGCERCESCGWLGHCS